MIEDKTKRTYTAKHFDNEDGTFKFRGHIGHIHYNNKLKVGDGIEGFREIDMTLVWDETKRGWGFDKHNFHPFLPEYADDWADFRDIFDEKDQTISYKPICSHVKGRLVPSIPQVTEQNAVIYDDAYGTGFDLIYYFTGTQMLKVVRIREAFKPTVDTTFDFYVKFSDPTMKVLRKFDTGEEYELDISKPKTFDNARKTVIEKRDVVKKPKKEYSTILKEFKVWDSGFYHPEVEAGRKEQVINVDLLHDANGVILRKHIPATFLADSTGDVYTDTTTSYWAGAGDGVVVSPAHTNWDTAHDYTSGTAYYTFAQQWAGTRHYSSGNKVFERQFYPVDTSALGAVTISDASLFAYFSSKYDQDNDTEAYFNVVQTTQASNTSLTGTDLDECGAVDNPTVGATEIDITSISTSGYTEFVLNATGQGWIDGSGYTKLGIREGHDAEDSPQGSNTLNLVLAEQSEQTGTSKDPYLEVTYTVGGGATFIPKVVFMN